MTDRRELLTVAFGLTAAAGLSGAVGAQGAPGSAGHMSLAECIALCLKCHAVCQETVTQTLSAPARPEPLLVLSLLDCDEICQATANSMLRGSPVHAAFCAEACRKSKAAVDLEACADVCRDCAISCRQMAGSMS